MPTPTYDIELNFSPVNAIFTNGEKGIGLTPIENVTILAEPVTSSGEQVTTNVGTLSAGTYYVSRWFQFGEGIYDLKLFFSASGSIQFGTEPPITVTAHTPYIGRVAVGDGNIRVNVVLNHVAVGEVLFFAFQVYRQDRIVYLSHSDEWLYDTLPMGDASLVQPVDPRMLLPVLAVAPNWEAGITERVAYLTDVMVSETGVEQRRTLRKWPRRQFEVEFIRQGKNRVRLDTFFANIGRQVFLFPLWHEQFRPTAGVPIAVEVCQFPAGTLSLREFKVTDIVLITAGDPDDYELLEVAAINTTLDRITWRDGPMRNWGQGTKLVPLRRAQIINKATQAAPTDSVGIFRAQVDLVDPDDRFNPSWGYCVPLWRFKAQRSDQLDIGYERQDYVVDNDTGPVVYTDPGKRVAIDTRFSVIARGRAMMVALRQFIGAARGRAKRFWIPSMTTDLVPTSNLGGASIDIAPSGAADYIENVQWARKYIGIYFNDGSPTIYRAVLGVQPLGEPRITGERLLLDRDVPPIQLAQVASIQFVIPSRFDQDSFEFHHLVDESAAVRLNAVTQSADGTGMPAIECSLTSKIYPVVHSDSMDFSMGIAGAKLHTGPLNLDELSSGLSVDDAALRVALQTYNAPAEDSINATVSITGAALNLQGFQSLTQPTEAVDMGVEITASTLRVALLTKTIDTESLNTGIEITAGTLT